MLRSQLLRVTARPVVSALSLSKPTRQYATTPPPSPLSGQAPKPKPKGSDNTLIYIALGLAAAGGAYVYFNNAEDIDAKAKADEREIKRKGLDAAEATKSRVDDAYRHAKAQGQSKMDSARSSIDDTAGDVATRAQGLAENAEAKYGHVRDATMESLAKARGSTETLYKGARAFTERTAEHVSAEAGKGQERMKRGWFSWLGWGESKAEKAKEKGEEKAGT